MLTLHAFTPQHTLLNGMPMTRQSPHSALNYPTLPKVPKRSQPSGDHAQGDDANLLFFYVTGQTRKRSHYSILVHWQKCGKNNEVHYFNEQSTSEYTFHSPHNTYLTAHPPSTSGALHFSSRVHNFRSCYRRNLPLFWICLQKQLQVEEQENV